MKFIGKGNKLEKVTMHPLFEDNHLLVLNKPAGLLTQPSGTGQDSLEQRAKAWLKDIYHKPGRVFLEAVHRLDKPVSGVVVFGKTSKALTRLNACIRTKQTRKTYWAWVEGTLTENQGELEHCLIHDDFHAKVVDVQHPEGKISRLTYRVLMRKKERTLLEIELETGRYHQIRLQLAAIGHPIWGDRKYGSQHPYESNAIALHHQRLQLPHPISQEWLSFEAPPPFAFEALGEYTERT
jgi:23S rRNA pseudouridine1911/1915/1917 synthase